MKFKIIAPIAALLFYLAFAISMTTWSHNKTIEESFVVFIVMWVAIPFGAFAYWANK